MITKPIFEYYQKLKIKLEIKIIKNKIYFLRTLYLL